jgi:luciferase family oxidoreductase group 1
MAALTQATHTIRLGSGGVMLVNYSPLKVAEVFMALEALAPGRIDLGVGRALGTDGRTGGALRSAGSEAFPQYFALLNAWLLDAGGVEPITETHPARGIHASPSGPSHPDIFLLCSSAETADFAGRAGVGMVFAEFIARSDGGPAVSAYRAAFAPSAFRSEGWTAVATIALAAETAEAAERLAAPMRASALAGLDGPGADGERPRFARIEDALAFLDARRDDPRLAGVIARAITGRCDRRMGPLNPMTLPAASECPKAPWYPASSRAGARRPARASGISQRRIALADGVVSLGSAGCIQPFRRLRPASQRTTVAPTNSNAQVSGSGTTPGAVAGSMAASPC